ncbi:MAG: CusA/CzcA family heavy metal efflux RND transporter, partial [Gammaproteobacteria bacterium]
MIDSIIRTAVERRILMLSLGLLIIVTGWLSLQKLPIDAVPDITNVQVQINTVAPGYSPLEVEQRISYPIETALYGLPGLSYSRSLSRYGLSQVTAVFEEGTDILTARNLVNIRLATVSDELPAGLTPQMSPISTGLGEIFMYTVQAEPGSTQADGQPWDATALREVQDWIIKPQLAQVKGVIEVNSIGGHTKQYHVNPDPAKLLYYQISIAQLSKALSANNDNRGAGYIERNGQQLLVRSPGQLRSIDDIKQVIVTEHNSVPIRVGDIADISIGNALRSGAALFNGEETVLGTAMMLMGENSRVVARAIAKKLDALQSSLPEGVSATAVYDRTTLINKTINTVTKNLLEGALLVIVILFLMLGNLRAALITAAVIPLAMLATISGMVQTRVSANLMSLGALDFGLIVDGSIIIVENTLRRMAQAQQNGALDIQQRSKVVFQATKEVIKPSVVGIAIITVVYVPIFTLTGVEGKMFHPMAITVVMALLAAMLLSLTVVPAALVLLLNKPLKLGDKSGIDFARVQYEKALTAVLKKPLGVIGIAIACFIASVALLNRLGSEFVPQLNEGDFAVQSIRISGTGLEQSIAMQRYIDKQVATRPEVAHVFSRIGTAEVATDPMPPGIADGYVILKPRADWPNP